MLTVVIHNKPQCIKRLLSSSSLHSIELERNNIEYGFTEILKFLSEEKCTYRNNFKFKTTPKTKTFFNRIYILKLFL
jgi:hypothetical protein